MWAPSRHLGSLTGANWVSFDFSVSYSSDRGYSLINTLKLKNKQLRSYYKSMGKQDKIGTEAFQWARSKVFNWNKT